MRIVSINIALFVLLAACPILASASETPPALSRNPFSRPPSEAIADVRVEPGRDGPVTAKLELQATMIGTANKFANVGGRILKPGDEVQGHVLVAIHEQYAVFRKNGKAVTVYVKPMAEDDE